MCLAKRIRDGLFTYYRDHGGSRRWARHLSCLYLYAAQRASDQEEKKGACYEALYWLKQSGVELRVRVEEFTPEEVVYILRRVIFKKSRTFSRAE